MTKKDYVLIAQVLHRYVPLAGTHESMLWEALVNSFAGRLKAENPNFNAIRFMDACNTGKGLGVR